MALLASLIMLSLLAAPAKATLPTPLSDFDVAQYTRLFELQQQGNMKQATREMGRLAGSAVKRPSVVTALPAPNRLAFQLC